MNTLQVIELLISVINIIIEIINIIIAYYVFLEGRL